MSRGFGSSISGGGQKAEEVLRLRKPNPQQEILKFSHSNLSLAAACSLRKERTKPFVSF